MKIKLSEVSQNRITTAARREADELFVGARLCIEVVSVGCGAAKLHLSILTQNHLQVLATFDPVLVQEQDTITVAGLEIRPRLGDFNLEQPE